LPRSHGVGVGDGDERSREPGVVEEPGWGDCKCRSAMPATRPLVILAQDWAFSLIEIDGVTWIEGVRGRRGEIIHLCFWSDVSLSWAIPLICSEIASAPEA
jgi:hypothetical protein